MRYHCNWCDSDEALPVRIVLGTTSYIVCGFCEEPGHLVVDQAMYIGPDDEEDGTMPDVKRNAPIDPGCCDSPEPRVHDASGRFFCGSCRRWLDRPASPDPGDQDAPSDDDPAGTGRQTGDDARASQAP